MQLTNTKNLQIMATHVMETFDHDQQNLGPRQCQVQLNCLIADDIMFCPNRMLALQ